MRGLRRNAVRQAAHAALRRSLLIANATGCSSIYGGNLPTTPYTIEPRGRGPAWSNSLFEDNAEFGLGFRLALGRVEPAARDAACAAAPIDSAIPWSTSCSAPTRRPKPASQASASGCGRCAGSSPRSTRPRRAGWIVGRLPGQEEVWLVGATAGPTTSASAVSIMCSPADRDVNVLVLDTEVYSNTGGQQSKATPLGAAAKFAAAGKDVGKKDLGLIAMHVWPRVRRARRARRQGCRRP